MSSRKGSWVEHITSNKNIEDQGRHDDVHAFINLVDFEYYLYVMSSKSKFILLLGIWCLCAQATAGPLTTSFRAVVKVVTKLNAPVERIKGYTEFARTHESLAKTFELTSPDAIDYLEIAATSEVLAAAERKPFEVGAQDASIPKPKAPVLGSWEGSSGIPPGIEIGETGGLRVEPIQHFPSSVFRVSFVHRDVKDFVEAFKRGYKDSEKYLEKIQNDPTHKTVYDDWKRTPKEKRVFLAGSGKDTGSAQRLKTHLKNDRGFSLFFYDFCARMGGELCAVEVIGAFYRDAEHALVMNTLNAAKSEYVVYEVATAQRLRAGKPTLILFTPGEVWTASTSIPISILYFDLLIDDE